MGKYYIPKDFEHNVHIECLRVTDLYLRILFSNVMISWHAKGYDSYCNSRPACFY